VKYPGETIQRLPDWLKQKQPRSEDLIRHRKYHLCVVCEERPAVGTNTEMLVRIRTSGEVEELTGEAVVTKWWTCQKCEEGTK
jgi:hypothetical protein